MKPSNLFLVGGDVSQVKILDFGIARRIAASSAMTRTGMVIGTPEYMAPEQARGWRELTPAADLFSLGCVLYECLTGQPPFVGDHIAAVLVQILFEEPVPIEQRRPGLPAPLVALLRRLLAKDPAQRLGDAAALRTALLDLGELPEPALAATVAGQALRNDGFAHQEQSLFSVVLAALEEEATGLGPTQPGSAVYLTAAERQALLQVLAALGTSPDFLADGTLVVTVPPMESARDQAALAAQAALIAKDRWPGSVVAMATGRGAISGRTAFGEVVERAAQSLKTGRRPLHTPEGAGVWIDSVSAKLLEGRFAQIPQAGGAVLLYEERDDDASRPLLGKPTPCVGRDAELGSLEGLLSSCCEESEARVVLVTAPSGTGKSRLRHEFLCRVDKRSDAVTKLIGRGDMMSAGAPYGILATALRRLCGVANRDPSDSQRQRLRARIARHIADTEAERVVLFLGEMCGVPFPDEGRPALQAARQDPKLMRDCLHRALLDFLAAECTAAPVLVILDDLQWGDALTISVLDEALRELAGARLFVLALARPEVHTSFPKLWQGHKTQEIHLKGLSKKACERLIQQVLGPDIAPTLLASAVEQSAGNALFLEEIIRSIADGKLEEQPETVLAMLQARIGRLAAGPRRAVRAAAVFGQTLWAGGVAAILGQPKASAEVVSWLAALTDAELIQPHARSRLRNEKEYSFRHALVRDAAYGLLTESDLPTGHRLAAEFLEQAGFDDLSIIAEHYYQSGERARALPFFIRSAQQSYDQHALDQMQRRAERGLACGAQGEQLGILRTFQVHAAVGSSDWPRVLALGPEALDLLTPGGLPWCSVIPFLGGIQFFTGQIDRGVATACRFVGTEPACAARAAYLYSAMYFVILLSQGGLRAAAKMVLARMDQFAAKTGNDDVHACAPMQFSRAAYLRSFEPDPYGQIVAAQQAAAAYQQLGNLREACVCATFIGEMQAEAGDVATGVSTVRESLALASRLRQPNLINSCYLHLAAVLARREDLTARHEAQELMDKVDALPGLSVGFRSWAHAIKAELLLRQGDYDAAAEQARQALELPPVAPLRRLMALTTAVHIHLRNERAQEAHRLAEEGLTQAESLGGGGYSELPLRLAVAEARHAVGDWQGALAVIQVALDELARRAALIVDTAARTRYLTSIPEHTRIAALAASWGQATRSA